LSFPPLLPSVGFAGTLQIGTFRGSAAVAFNAAAPTETMLAISFNELHLLDLVGTMCGQHVVAAVPPELRRTALDIGMRDVEIAVVPVDTTIGELHFEQGTRARGELTFWGVRGRGSLVIDERTGVSCSAQLDPVSLGNGALTFTASGGAGGPSLSLDLPPLALPSIFLSGAVSLLGLSADTQVTFSDQGFAFHAEGRIFDLFSCSLDAKGSFGGLASDVWLRVALRNDLFEYLRREASEAIRVAADVATRDIEAARRDVARAQADVNRLNGNIAAMRRTIEAERDRDARNLQAAQASVASAQREVSRLDGDIAAMRRTIEAERDRDARNLKAAQASVASAQRDVNSLQAEIDAAKARIAGLTRDIHAKRRWFDRLAWYDKAWGWTVLSGYSTAKGAEITANYTTIGALEAAKHTAIGTLELAKQTLRGFEAAARTVPVDADPRIVGLFTARGSAVGALELAKQTLAGFEAAARTVPVDADPRIVGLYTALGTATAGLTVADGVLRATQASVGAVADVATFIANVGLGGLIDIRAASFEAYLSAAAGGSVQLDMVLSFLRRPLTLSLGVDLANPLSAAQALAERLLDGLGR
jgi:predicted  nucleic acid-binding Zn-ribbon protein